MNSEDPQRDDQQQSGSSSTAIDDLFARYGGKKIGLVALGICVLLAPPIVWAATRDSSDSGSDIGPSTAQAAAAGCELHEFEYGVTNDKESGRAYQREALLGAHPPLPNAGYRAGDAPPKLGVVLHTLAHGWLVVKYDDALDSQSKARLREFAKAAGPNAAVIPGGPDQNAAIAAIRWGHGLNCADAGAEAIAVLRQFERLPPKL